MADVVRVYLIWLFIVDIVLGIVIDFVDIVDVPVIVDAVVNDLMFMFV